MDNWVREFAMTSGKLTAIAATGAVIPLAQLAQRGLPCDQSTRKGRLEVDFSNFSQVESREYRDAFGIELESGYTCQHAVFEARFKRTTLVVPALALLRAIFRPSMPVLARAFTPHFIDLIAHVDTTQQPPRLQPDSSLPAITLSSRHSNPLQTFAWLYCHPSARAMAGSVHQRALQGAVSLTMPAARATLAVQGKAIGDKLFVTALTLISVSPSDTPVVDCDLTSNKYLLRGTRVEAEDARAVHCERLAPIPIHADGTVELTDPEWSQIDKLLQTRRGSHNVRLSQRAIADGVLNKLHSGRPWSQVPYREGNALNARSALNAWTGDGRWQAILEVLRTHRMARAT